MGAVGPQLERGSHGQTAEDVPGTRLGLVTSIPHQQKHTYRCHGGQHINKYKYVQIIYLKK